MPPLNPHSPRKSVLDTLIVKLTANDVPTVQKWLHALKKVNIVSQNLPQKPSCRTSRTQFPHHGLRLAPLIVQVLVFVYRCQYTEKASTMA